MRISDWSSDVCSSDLLDDFLAELLDGDLIGVTDVNRMGMVAVQQAVDALHLVVYIAERPRLRAITERSEEHTTELQSLMRNSYAVFCLNKKKEKIQPTKSLTD